MRLYWRRIPVVTAFGRHVVRCTRHKPLIEENILINSQLVDSDFFLGDRKWRRSSHHPSLSPPDPANDASTTTRASGDVRFATIVDMERSREAARFAAIVDMGMSSRIAGFAYHALITYHALYAECALDALMDTGR